VGHLGDLAAGVVEVLDLLDEGLVRADDRVGDE
jgi:hypothetical protein